MASSENDSATPADAVSGTFVTQTFEYGGGRQVTVYVPPGPPQAIVYAGDGQGMIVQRGFPKPPPLFQPDLLKAKAQLFYNTITNGHGVMYSYADRVLPADRWAIVAYIRALQRSQHAQVASLSDKIN